MNYLVVCSNRPEIPPGHRHIVSVGTGEEPGGALDSRVSLRCPCSRCSAR
jgi:hypothetical protein